MLLKIHLKFKIQIGKRYSSSLRPKRKRIWNTMMTTDTKPKQSRNLQNNNSKTNNSIENEQETQIGNTQERIPMAYKLKKHDTNLY